MNKDADQQTHRGEVPAATKIVERLPATPPLHATLTGLAPLSSNSASAKARWIGEVEINEANLQHNHSYLRSLIKLQGERLPHDADLDDLFADADDIPLKPEPTRALLDTLITNARLYETTADYKALLDFVVRLRNFAPFNAMLLQVQKPGLTYAASAADWLARFGRKPKYGARPLLILWPFGPVALVYDVMDTEGRDLPRDVASFFAHGPIGEKQVGEFRHRTGLKDIHWDDLDAGDGKAGSIRCVHRASKPMENNVYRMLVNKNHPPVTRFVTLTHELAHLFLGHLGPDKKLSIPERELLSHRHRELEAESVAFIVCARNGVTSKSETYLKHYVDNNTGVGDLDIYQIMRAAGQIETLLGIGATGGFGNAKRARR